MKFLFLSLLFSTKLLGSDFIGAFIENRANKNQVRFECLKHEQDTCTEAHFVKVMKKQVVELNPSLIFDLTPEGRFDKAYALAQIRIKSTTSRAPFPYVWFMFNMQSMNRKLLKIFPLLESAQDKRKKISLSKKNFQALIEAIEVY